MKHIKLIGCIILSVAMLYGNIDIASASSSGQILSKAWKAYTNKNYKRADTLFTQAIQRVPHKKIAEARLGLAYTRLKRDMKVSAATLFAQLARQQYKVPETFPAAMRLSFELRDYKTMETLVTTCQPNERKKWEKKIIEAKLRTIFSPSLLNGPDQPFFQAVKQYQRQLQRCTASEILLNITDQLQQRGRKEQASQLLTSLFACQPSSELRIGILNRLCDAGAHEKALQLTEQELATTHSSTTYQQQLTAVKKHILQKMLAALGDSDNTRCLTLADQILKISPNDTGTLIQKGWCHYRKKEYSSAQNIFQRLVKKNALHTDAVLGLAYSLYGQKKYQKAYQLIKKDAVLQTPEIETLRILLLERMIETSLVSEDQQEAEILLQELMQRDPGNAKCKIFQAHTFYNNGEIDQAIEMLEQAFANEKSAEIAEKLLVWYQKQNKKSSLRDLLAKLSEPKNKKLNKIAASWYFNNGKPLLAAQIDPSSQECCYENADTIYGKIGLAYRNKSGDTGKSKLSVLSLDADIKVPYGLGNQLLLGITADSLSAGSATTKRVGNYFRFFDGTQPSVPDVDLDIYSIFAGWEHQGITDWQLVLGTSPINGPIEITPVGWLSIAMNGWDFEIHRESVKGSVLSWTGMKDPYSQKHWGRITRNGANISKTIGFGKAYWLTGSLGIDWYRGENVWNNKGWTANLSFGKTSPFRENMELTWGVYATGAGFDHNTNHFSFGHGGYYSPQQMFAAGPLFRIKTIRCKDYWFDLQLAAGGMIEKTDDSPFYPLQTTATTFTQTATDELLGFYQGDQNTRFTYSSEIEAWKLLNDWFALGAFASYSGTADYEEWQVGLALEVFNDPQSLFWEQRKIQEQWWRKFW